MAEFCAQHLKEVLGLHPDSKMGKHWLAKDGSPCKVCQFAYLSIPTPKCPKCNDPDYVLLNQNGKYFCLGCGFEETECCGNE